MAALLLNAVGIERSAFTPVFAIGCSVGWIAHALGTIENRSDDPFRPGLRRPALVGDS
jgi:citrate synthase